MAKTVERIRNGLWRATKWFFALLIIAYVGWLMGLGPKSYRAASSYLVPAYFSNPDPDCRAGPTPECLAEMAEQSIYDIYDHYGGYPLEAEYVGMLHARLGNFDRADQLAAWLEEHRNWEPLDDGYEGPVTPFYKSKIEYLLGAEKWREALAMVAEFGGTRQGAFILSSKCDDMRSIAFGRAVEGVAPDAYEILAKMAKSGCGEDNDSLSETRRTIELLLLLHLPRDQAVRHADYQKALWEWLSAPQGNLWISWKTPPGWANYCDVLASVDHNGQLEEWQLKTLLSKLLSAGAMPRTKEVLERITSRPSEKKWLLDWLRDEIGFGFMLPDTVTRLIADNYLTDEERRLIAPRVAEGAASSLDEDTIEWAKAYLDETEYQEVRDEYEANRQGDMAMFYRLVRIQVGLLHDPSKNTEPLKALSDEYIWRWYQVPLPNFSDWRRGTFDQQTDVVTALFRYGEYEDGFELIRDLAYQPGALTAAAWGLKYEGPKSCASPN